MCSPSRSRLPNPAQSTPLQSKSAQPADAAQQQPSAQTAPTGPLIQLSLPSAASAAPPPASKPPEAEKPLTLMDRFNRVVEWFADFFQGMWADIILLLKGPEEYAKPHEPHDHDDGGTCTHDHDHDNGNPPANGPEGAHVHGPGCNHAAHDHDHDHG